MSVLEAITTSAVDSFYDSNNTYMLPGLQRLMGAAMTPVIRISCRWSGTSCTTRGSHVLQAVANVGQVESRDLGVFTKRMSSTLVPTTSIKGAISWPVTRLGTR